MNEEEKASLFVSALVSESDIDRSEIVTTGKSVGKIMDDSRFVSSHVRCMCGIHAGNEGLIQCTICSMFVHRKCTHITKDFDESKFICPFCMFQNYSIDPLASLSNAFDSFNAQIQGIYGILKRFELLEKETLSLYDALSKPGLDPNQIASYDESYRQILAAIAQLNLEWKEKTKIVKSMQNALYSVPVDASPTTN